MSIVTMECECGLSWTKTRFIGTVGVGDEVPKVPVTCLDDDCMYSVVTEIRHA